MMELCLIKMVMNSFDIIALERIDTRLDFNFAVLCTNR